MPDTRQDRLRDRAATGGSGHTTPGVQLASMGNDVPATARDNIERLAGAVNNLQAHGTASGRGHSADLQGQITALRGEVGRLSTLVNSLNQRLTAAGF
jgi:hypothetical protein